MLLWATIMIMAVAVVQTCENNHFVYYPFTSFPVVREGDKVTK